MAEIDITSNGVKTKPTLYKMVLESLKTNKTSKGLSLQGIKRYITETYPHTKENFSNLRLRTAMKKGMESKEIIRPKSSEGEGLTGHFLINRTLLAKVEQEKKKKATKSASKEKVTKSPKKKTAAKSPSKVSKSPGKKTAKSLGKKKTVVGTPKKPANKKSVKATIRKTPKANKAESAGAHAKTASVKRLNKTTKAKKSKK